jgi:hypothetical protein
MWAFQGHIDVDRGILDRWARLPAARDAAGGRDPVALLESETAVHQGKASELGRLVGSRWGRLIGEGWQRRGGARG